ncbi:hypothetical protein G6F31_017594 [Rhizopus arrhizus]|nr:hypothetical protein G6F31_017594 [Rhizopus arrhizus]
MAEGVAEVEQGALALLERIAFDNRGLVPAAACDRFGQHAVYASNQRLGILLQPVEEGGIAQRTVLHHFGQAGTQFARWQGGQHAGISDHRAWRVEGADQVLASRDVHRGLAAHRRIDHRQQGGRQLHAVHPAHPARRSEARQVTDHAAAQREHAGIAGGTQRGQRFDGAAELGQGLGGFARSQHVFADDQRGATSLSLSSSTWRPRTCDASAAPSAWAPAPMVLG